MYAGEADIRREVEAGAAALPAALAPLATIAMNYRWSWAAAGAAVFAELDPDRWARGANNPKRLLMEVPRASLERASSRPAFVDRVHALGAELAADLARPPAGPSAGPADGAPTGTTADPARHPIAFMCAEFGVHGSLPIYSGGLGALAGDVLKEASDLALPMVGVGLMYRTGYFHQRIDSSGYQHEYWVDTDPELLPCALVHDERGVPIRISVPVDDDDVEAQIWRVDVGRVPLYLLDTDLPGNSPVGRWITSRLYEANPAIRLAQYAVLGVGGVRVLAALGIEPALFHFNEGHPALGLFELVGVAMADGATPEAAWASAKARTVFTTHTPVAAGNEMYSRDQIVAMLGRIGDLIGDRERFLALGRIHPDDPGEPSGMTPLAIRSTRSTNAVSRVHGEVARRMWQPMFPGRDVAGVPITHVTNGVHIPTWLDGPMRELFDRRLGAGWSGRADDETVWAAIDDISDGELWAARTESRRGLLDMVRSRVVSDRLRRGEELSYSEAGAAGFDLDRLTLGFARRLATYKRLYLVAREPERAFRLLAGDHGVQFVFAGKAHPSDDDAKRIVQGVFDLKRAPDVAGRVAFLEDYDIPLAARLVSGCDVWINLPRPPLEASGTSGMKAAMNGSLNLSVLDGWWAEAYDGTNGWAIDAAPGDEREQDSRDATRLFDLLEHEVVPMFHERDEHGLPRRWLAMVRSSLKTNGPRFSATRMVREYDTKIYRQRR